MSASYCFVLHGRCIAPRVRDSIFAEHQRPQVAAFMECVDFMQPRWPSRISTFNSIFCRSFRFGTRESLGDIVVTHLPAWVPLVRIVGISDTWQSANNIGKHFSDMPVSR